MAAPSLAARRAAAKKNKETRSAPAATTRTDDHNSAKSARTHDVAPSRKGKKIVSGWFQSDVTKQISMICAEHDITKQHFLAEALNDAFEKYGKARLADDTMLRKVKD